jgi:glycosyltransferase involved in cell wall biosynthesis
MVKEALRSVLASDFKDIEIILVDDASDDGGLDKLLDFIKQFKHIVYIRQDKNMGPGAARNRGLKAAKGEWVFFMDSDDVIYPEKLPGLIEFLKAPEQRNTDMVIINEVVYRHPDGNTENVKVCNGTVNGWINAHDDVPLIYSPHQMWKYCFCRMFLLQHNIKCNTAYQHEDWIFILYVYCYVKKISILNNWFYEYHIYQGLLSFINLKTETGRKKSAEARKLFFRSLAQICDSDIQKDSKTVIEQLLYAFILYSQWKPDLYQNSTSVCTAINKLRDRMACYTDAWRKKVYISPCFLEAPFAAKLINEWGGG